MRIVLLGAPGSGKRTQAQLLVEHFGIPQISPAELVRAGIEAESALGQQAKAAAEAGQQVTDELVLAMIRERLSLPDAAKGFILDGFPRNLVQAQDLDALLDQIGRPLQLALHVKVDYEALMERLTGRRTCESCGQTYNIYTAPPKMDDQCDLCGGNLRHRADDTEETIGNRIRVYENQTKPLNDYYQQQGKLRSVQGVGEIDDIFSAVRRIVESVEQETPPPAAPPAEVEAGPITLAELEQKVLATVRQSKVASKPTPEAGAPTKGKARAGAEKPSAAREPAKAGARKKPAQNAGATKRTAKKKTAAETEAAAQRPTAAKKKKTTAKKKVAAKTPTKKPSAKAAPKKKVVAKKPAVKAVPKKKATKPSVKAGPKKKAAAKKPTVKPVPKKKTTKASSVKAAPKKKAVPKKSAVKSASKKGSAKKPIVKARSKKKTAKAAPKKSAASQARPKAKAQPKKTAAGKSAVTKSIRAAGSRSAAKQASATARKTGPATATKKKSSRTTGKTPARKTAKR